MQRSESSFKTFDDSKIFYQFWEKPNALGTVVFTHGQGEHSDAYLRMVEGLKDTPWNFLGWDLRGHGRSDGQRGYAAKFDDYCRDFDLLLKHISSRPLIQDKKLVLLSHSMGGLIQTKTQFLFGLPTHVGQILSAPLFGVAVNVPLIKDLGAVVIHQILPRLTLGNEIKNSDLTRDADVIREFERDTLRHHKISSGVYLGMLESFPWVLERASEMKTPLLLQISDADPVVSTPKALEFFDKASSEYKFKYIYSGGRHETYNDIHRLSAYADLKNFLERFERPR